MVVGHIIGNIGGLKMAVGSTEAIRDWFNASIYNKEEIDRFFIQNNQQDLIPYELWIKSNKPCGFVKLVGQTSGKEYTIYLNPEIYGVGKA